MSEQSPNHLSSQPLLPTFGPGFLEDHARRLVTNPEIALLELVANCWDAGADRVDVNWPETSAPNSIKIEDNGTGMTHQEFTDRWLQFSYDRRQVQGEDVVFPPGNHTSHRKAFGRNGKGRHSMFCFTSEYRVETWRDGRGNVFQVTQTPFAGDAPYKIVHLETTIKEGHGTAVSSVLGRNHIKLSTVRELVGSKFITDPSFEVYINDELVEMTDLEHLIDTHELVVPSVGTVIVSEVDTTRTSRTSQPHGVAWWVHRRLVGEPSWRDLYETGSLDRRTVEAKRYTFVVQADCLVDDVEQDWSGFRKTGRFTAVCEAVGRHIRMRLADLMKEDHHKTKIAVLRENRESLTEIGPYSRYYIGRTIDEVQEWMPNVGERELSTMVRVLTGMEKSRSGYRLLDKLAELAPDDIDALNEILENWTVQDARIVLVELDLRLKLIERLEALVDDPSSDELHQIQPLFEKGLWIFGPEYESVHFASNRTLLRVIRELFGDESESKLQTPRRRPDFVVLGDSSLGIYSCDSFDDTSVVNGVGKVLVVELKRGGSAITIEDRRQGEDYARELQRSGKIQRWTKMKVFVLGTTIEPGVEFIEIGENTKVYPRPYSVVLRQAHARTFHLKEKIEQAKQGQLLDADVENVIRMPEQTELMPIG